jgi:DNA polymerase III alpha subunit (gram-positive type)
MITDTKQEINAPSKKPQAYFCVDIETGGLSTNTSLLSVYGIVVDENLKEIDSIDLKLKPDDYVFMVDASALAVNKIDLVSHAKSAVTYSTANEKLSKFLGQYAAKYGKMALIGQNFINFDLPFIEQYILPNISEFFKREFFDTRTIGLFLRDIGVLPASNVCSLADQLKFFFPELEFDGHHNAEWDARQTLKLYQAQQEVIKKLKG